MEKNKIYVNFPYEKREEAKRAGAKWDWVHKSWYFEGSVPPQYFGNRGGKSFEDRLAEAKKRYKEKKFAFRSESSGIIKGKFYRGNAGCDNCCPPWEVCDKPCPLELKATAFWEGIFSEHI